MQRELLPKSILLTFKITNWFKFSASTKFKLPNMIQYLNLLFTMYKCYIPPIKTSPYHLISSKRLYMIYDVHFLMRIQYQANDYAILRIGPKEVEQLCWVKYLNGKCFRFWHNMYIQYSGLKGIIEKFSFFNYDIF